VQCLQLTVKNLEKLRFLACLSVSTKSKLIDLLAKPVAPMFAVRARILRKSQIPIPGVLNSIVMK
jgi:hypothetical protein